VHYIATREELELRANAILGAIRAGMLNPLAKAAQAHRDLESRKTTGKLLLLN